MSYLRYGDTGDVGDRGAGPADRSTPDEGAAAPQSPDLAVVAAQLGVTEEALMAALGEPGQGPPNSEAAAEALGVTVEELESALMNGSAAPTDAAQPSEQTADTNTQPAVPAAPPMDANNQPPAPGGQQAGAGGQPMIDLSAAAAQLGVTEAALQAALGDANQGPPDLVSAAQQLGVTEEALIAALGLPTDGPPVGGQRPGGGQQPPAKPTIAIPKLGSRARALFILNPPPMTNVMGGGDPCHFRSPKQVTAATVGSQAILIG